MGQSHGHPGHSHHHHHHVDPNSKYLGLAIAINLALSLAQVLGGLLSGSLSLVADALHNFSDAGALIIAMVARKIGLRPADSSHSYGYKRAEIIGTLINSSTLILVGLYLCYESILRYLDPQPIDGWIVVIVAGLALAVDIATAILTYISGAKSNMNLRAAFIHNVSDAMASVVVIISGTLIIFFQIYVIDLIATIAISFYVIYHGLFLVKKAIRILMQSVPEDLDLNEIKIALCQTADVVNADHVHLWQLDDKLTFFEGHLIVKDGLDRKSVRKQLKQLLESRFEIRHATIELIECKEVDGDTKSSPC